MLSSFKERGIESIKKAVEEDNKGNFQEALRSYTAGLEYLKTHIKYEKNEKVKETIEEKVSILRPLGIFSLPSSS